jgi:phosphatidylglycerol:prolipoprotein diacylglycerol transferase
MHPILVTLGGVDVHWYGVMGALGFIVVCVIALARSAALGMVKERVADVIFWTAIAGLVGARGLYVLLNWSSFADWHAMLNIRTGGLVFYGALILGLPAAAIMLWRWKLPPFALGDVFATALPFGHAIARVGCLFAGCCWGKPTDLPWGVVYSDPLAPGPHGIAVHPTQIYEAIYLTAIGALCTWYYPRRKFDGQVLPLYLGLYAVCRAFNEGLRDDPSRGFWFGGAVSTSQLLSVVLLALAAGIYAGGAWWANRRRANVVAAT